MRSRPEVRYRRLTALLLAGALAASAAAAPTGPDTPDAAASASAPPASAASGATAKVSLAQVRQAVKTLDDDPLLGGEQVRRSLRWVDDEEQKKRKKPPAQAWLRDLADWLSGAGRLLAWLGGAVLVAVAAVIGWRLWGAAPVVELPPTPPSHVGTLDIRPESLPEPVGAAAAALWQQGQARAALALLYRAALSRLVHRHRVEVRSASTEQECLALAATSLPPDGMQYLDRLVRAWLRCGYGHALPEAELVLALCADFDARLGPPPSREVAP